MRAVARTALTAASAVLLLCVGDCGSGARPRPVPAEGDPSECTEAEPDTAGAWDSTRPDGANPDADGAGADGVTGEAGGTKDAGDEDAFVPVPEALLPHPEWDCALEPGATAATCEIECRGHFHRDCPAGWSCPLKKACEVLLCVRDVPEFPVCVETSCPDKVTCEGPTDETAIDLEPTKLRWVCYARIDPPYGENVLCHADAVGMAEPIGGLGVPGGGFWVIRDEATWNAFWPALAPCDDLWHCLKQPAYDEVPEVDFESFILVVAACRGLPECEPGIRAMYEFPASGEVVLVSGNRYGPDYGCGPYGGASVTVFKARRPTSPASFRACGVFHAPAG
ncbi:MAG: hypothetical protein FJ087_02315 [Deltaproteobacteria bacterium]|nr:hypothetical protein [Deltaproteobacteria bacterium]